MSAAGKQILVVASHPGWAMTHPSHSWFLRSMSKPFIQSPAMGALPTIYAAVGEKVEGGKYFGPSGFMELKGFPTEVQPNKMAQNLELASKLWNLSEELTGVNYKNYLDN